jgi:protoporphyrinogen/coproporphyrinogen III oxidase
MTQVTILGGGISGLACAWFLSRDGLRPLLIEKSSRLGGLIKTDSIDDCLLEAGPDSFLAAKTSVAELAAQLGIASEVIPSNDAQRRIFIVRHGELAALPPGMVMMAPANLSAALRSPFYSASSKLRFLTELLSRPRHRHADLSIREFVSDHFGAETLDYVTEPLLSGVYGGNAGQLSVQSVLPRFLEYERKYGSLIRAVRHERAQAPAQTSLFQSFRDGMQTLTGALANAIRSETRVLTAEASAVEKTSGGWKISLDGESVETRHLVLGCPAHVNARLLRSSVPALSRELASIPYSSAILVTLVYDRQQLAHPLDGFGFLIPRRERRQIAAVTWVSTKFPSRTPPGLAALRAFLVGDEAVALANETDEDLLRLVRDDLARLMKISAPPKLHTVYRWPDSMPQYVVGHEQRQQKIRQLVNEFPGLHLCGNAYRGVGIPDCVRLASEVAQTIHTASLT